MPKFSQRDINLIKFFQSQGITFVDAKTGEELDIDGNGGDNNRSEKNTEDTL